MSRLLVVTASASLGLGVVIGLCLLMIGSTNSSVAGAVAASTPEGGRCTPCRKPDPQGSESGTPNAVPNVTELALSKTELQLPCSEQSARADDTGVEVTTTAEDADGDVLTYNYTASGGRIVGVGKRVHWSFLGIKPGTYSITAGVDDGCGICGRTETKTVTVLECSSE